MMQRQANSVSNVDQLNDLNTYTGYDAVSWYPIFFNAHKFSLILEIVVLWASYCLPYSHISMVSRLFKSPVNGFEWVRQHQKRA